MQIEPYNFKVTNCNFIYHIIVTLFLETSFFFLNCILFLAVYFISHNCDFSQCDFISLFQLYLITDFISFILYSEAETDSHRSLAQYRVRAYI